MERSPEEDLAGYCQLELIVARLDARPTKQTPEYSGFPLRGSRILSEIALKLTVPVEVQVACGILNMMTLLGMPDSYRVE